MKGQGEIEGIPVKMIILAFAIIIVIMVFMFFVRVAGTIMYGSCWQEAEDSIKGLQAGQNNLEFGDCIKKVTITSSISGLDCGIDNPKKDRIYAILEPNYGVWYMAPAMYVVDPIGTLQSRNQKLKCIELDYGMASPGNIYWRDSEESFCLSVSTASDGGKMLTKC